MGEAAGGAPVEALLAQMTREMGAERDQTLHVQIYEAREPEYSDPSPPLPDSLQSALAQQGIAQLFSHQVEALERARRGEDLVVVTGTSSGKTLCYNLPVIEAILADRSRRALYLYPINALINDQLKSLFRLNVGLGDRAIGVARYTGALGSAERQAARARDPHIWLVNPEMLHLSYLLWHKNWERFWRRLSYIVIDEVHTYRGVFGANMAQLLRRVLRVARHYGSSPQFICCSATMSNPEQLVESLTGRRFSVVDRDGAGQGRRFFALWNPPLLNDDGSNRRRPYAQEAVDLFLRCLRANMSAIVFVRARRLAEQLLRTSQQSIESAGELDLARRISSYRAGYLAEEREAVEARLKAGDIRGIITTNALEMGIDIGGLDAAIIAGYPGTIMSTWQQAGRAGRRGRDALVVLVGSQNPLDQYYMAHPEAFFTRPHELAVIDLDNQHILQKHLLCAARELPLLPAELTDMPAAMRRQVEALKAAELLEPVVPRGEASTLTYPTSRRDIHLQVSLRSAGQEPYRILNEDEQIGSIEPPNVFREAHPGAIYQHGDEDYRVVHLDRRARVVRVRREPLPHYTRAISALSLQIEADHRPMAQGPRESVPGPCYSLGLGDVLVEETLYGYREIAFAGDKIVRRVNLERPLLFGLHTMGMWITLPDGEALLSVKEGAETALDRGLHALEHLLLGVLPLLVMCDRRDVDGFYHRRHPDLLAPAVFVYDTYDGGIGLAEVAYQRATELMALAYKTVSSCRCVSGCPSCVQSGSCRQRNESLDKHAAQSILAALLAGRDDINSYSAGVQAPYIPLLQHATGGEHVGQTRAVHDLDERTRRHGLHRGGHLEAEPVSPRFVAGEWVEQSPYGRGIVLKSRMDGHRELVQVRFMRRGLVREVDASVGTLRKVCVR